MRLFISYSHIDKPSIQGLISDLRTSYGYDNVWFDDELKRYGGQDWEQRIAHEIRSRNIVLFLMSNDSIASLHCQKEILLAKNSNIPILPIIIRPRTVIPNDFENLEYVDMQEGLTTKTLSLLYASIQNLLNDNIIPLSQLDKSEKKIDFANSDYQNGDLDPSVTIAESTSKRIRVVAGPGTGKTYSLMKRVKKLLETTNPSDILLITFSRAAARDIRYSLENMQIAGTENIAASTLHSFCLNLLKSWEVLVQMGRGNRLLLEYETYFLLQDLKDSSGAGNFYARLRKLRAFEAAWARENYQEPGWPSDENDRLFQQALYEWLSFHLAIHISEVIPETWKYLWNNPASSIFARYKHIMVDEYQDLNRAEQSVLDLLSRRASMVVVGDIDQSIYENLRFAHPEGILDFDKRHNPLQDVPIRICRRCPANIVAMANSLIERNTIRRQDYFIAPESEHSKGEVHVVQWGSQDNEIYGLAEFISTRIKRGDFLPNKVLVLCPRRAFGYQIRAALQELGQGSHCYFRANIFEGNPKEEGEYTIQEAFTLLKLANDTDDRVALRAWLGFGDKDLRFAEYRQLWDLCIQNRKSPRLLLDDMVDSHPLVPYLAKLADRYLLLREHFKSLDGKSDMEKFLYIFPKEQTWTEEFHSIVSELNEETDLKNIISQIELEAIHPDVSEDENLVKIVTLHSSKGLEADLVIIPGCVRSIIPSIPPNELSAEEQTRFREEQRRLFYVAITRARKALVLSSYAEMKRNKAYPIGAKLRGARREIGTVDASPFISELGAKCPIPIHGDEWRY